MHDVRVALGLEEPLDANRAGPAHPREVVASEVDEHDVLRPVLLRGEQALRVAFAGGDRPGDRVQAGTAALELHVRLGRGADEATSPSSSRKRYGEGLTRRSAR